MLAAAARLNASDVSTSSAAVDAGRNTVTSAMSAAGVTPDAVVDQTAATLDVMTSLHGDVVMTNIWLRVVFVVLYTAIFLVGLSGNSLVVYVVSRNTAMRTITNIFIANLAVSDIIMCLPSTWLYTWLYPCLPERNHHYVYLAVSPVSARIRYHDASLIYLAVYLTVSLSTSLYLCPTGRIRHHYVSIIYLPVYLTVSLSTWT